MYITIFDYGLNKRDVLKSLVVVFDIYETLVPIVKWVSYYCFLFVSDFYC